MRLQRVQIPNFRVLKDIDITFEDYHILQTFPLASQNGAGKSTFLQLVFVLLKGCHGKESEELIRNLLENSHLDSSVCSSDFSTITLIDDGKKIELEIELSTYDILRDSYLHNLNTIINKNQFNIFKSRGINGISDYIEELKKLSVELEKSVGIDGVSSQMIDPTKSLNIKSSNYSRNILSQLRSTSERGQSIHDREKERLKEEIKLLNTFLSDFNAILLAKKIRVVHSSQNTCLIYKFSSDEEYLDLAKVSESISMAAPSSQVFQFLSPEELSSLFESSSKYYTILEQKQKVISNLFLFELSSVKILLNAFKIAFNNDRLQALKSGGEYGNEFKLLLNDLKDFLHGKTIQPSEDMSRIVIKQKNNDGLEIELSPADLSHGELRQLSLYVWLKTSKIKNSIVLIDEIEIALHPDWQYQIVRNLEEWEPTNQYILATHSYDVCSALSPSHVKEIEPNLSKVDAKAAQ